MSGSQVADILAEAEAPEMLNDFILKDLQLGKIADFVAYVVREDYQAEWKQIVEGAFPLREAVAGTDAVEAQPATTIG